MSDGALTITEETEELKKKLALLGKLDLTAFSRRKRRNCRIILVLCTILTLFILSFADLAVFLLLVTQRNINLR